MTVSGQARDNGGIEEFYFDFVNESGGQLPVLLGLQSGTEQDGVYQRIFVLNKYDHSGVYQLRQKHNLCDTQGISYASY